jgi:hypothetical protein
MLNINIGRIFRSKADKQSEQPQAEEVRPDIRNTFEYNINSNSAEFHRFIRQAVAEVATTKEIVDWLEKYFAQGGKISHVSFLGDEVYISRRSADLPAGMSMNVIVSSGTDINVLEGGGHRQLFMDDGSVKSSMSIQSVMLGAKSIVELNRRGYSLRKLKGLYDSNCWDRKSYNKALREALSGVPVTHKISDHSYPRI